MRVANAFCVVPHAPLLCDLPGRPEHPAPLVRAALAELNPQSTVVVVSPHGASTGVYSSSGGDLAGFGLPGIRASAPVDEDLAGDIATRWGVPRLAEDWDHGAVVPLALVGCASVVVCALKEWTGQDDSDPRGAIEAGRELADVLGSLDGVTLMIGGHTGAALSPRAPLTHRPDGNLLHEEMVGALGADPARLAAIGPEPWRRAGACGAGPFQIAARLAGPLEVVASEAPFGVGYVVARG